MTDDIIERLSDFWPDHPAERKLIGDATTEITLLRSSVKSLISERDAARAEVDLLRAEIERLRAQMQEIRERLYLAAGHAAAAALLSEEAHRRALEGKP